jgi:hypothetical protein
MNMTLHPAVVRSFFSGYCHDLKRLFAISDLYFHDEVAAGRMNLVCLNASRDLR